MAAKREVWEMIDILDGMTADIEIHTKSAIPSGLDYTEKENAIKELRTKLEGYGKLFSSQGRAKVSDSFAEEIFKAKAEGGNSYEHLSTAVYEFNKMDKEKNDNIKSSIFGAVAGIVFLIIGILVYFLFPKTDDKTLSLVFFCIESIKDIIGAFGSGTVAKVVVSGKDNVSGKTLSAAIIFLCLSLTIVTALFTTIFYPLFNRTIYIYLAICCVLMSVVSIGCVIFAQINHK